MDTGAGSRGRGGYGRLDRTVILDAALRIAARPGADDVRFRDLGAELGADPTAVYRHFHSKDDLMAALIDRLMEDVASRVPRDASWRLVLQGVAADLLDTFARRPAIGMHVADDRPVGRAELALVDCILRALEEAGLQDQVLVDHYSALSGFSLSYIASTCRELVLAGRSTLPGADQLPWLSGDEVSEQSHPAFARYRERLLALDFRSTYSNTIAVLIDAVGRAGRSAPE